MFVKLLLTTTVETGLMGSFTLTQVPLSEETDE